MAGRKSTSEVVQERRHVVEAALVAGEWSLRVQDQLADRYGVTPRQIRHVRRPTVTRLFVYHNVCHSLASLANPACFKMLFHVPDPDLIGRLY